MSASFFAGTRPGRETVLGGKTFELPILYFRDDMFAAFHTADLAAVRAALPSDRLHPLALPGGRALAAVVAFNYVDTSIGPYGEVGVVVPAVHGTRPPPVALLPGLLESRYPGFGNVVLHLPVTTRDARDGGRGQWGYTKFVSDMRFEITPEYQQCELGEAGAHILTLRVARRGLITKDEKPLTTYSVRDGRLLRTCIPMRGICRNALRPPGCFLRLGSHPVADSIRALGLSERPLLTRYYLERAAILPEGEVVEEGVRALDGFKGSDREGELTVDYLGGH
jgi:hypothetical protein